MKIKLICLGTQMPAWVNQGFQEYAKRLQHKWPLTLVEINIPKRTKNSVLTQIIAKEATLIADRIAANEYLIALDERGKHCDSPELSEKLKDIEQSGQNVALIIGGPDGLAPEIKARAQQIWSLSHLTLPHGIVRIMVAEQLYRALSISQGHPYHRD